MANEFKIKKGLIVNGSGSTILDIQGSQGQLFSVTDSLSGSLFSVNDISGLPILQVSSNDSVKLGTFNAEAIRVSGSNANMTGSLFGTSSWAVSASWAPTPTSVSTGSYALTSSNVLGGTANYIPLWNTATSLSSSILYQSASNVGIGTTTPGVKLQVNGNTTITGSLRVTGSLNVTGSVAAIGIYPSYTLVQPVDATALADGSSITSLDNNYSSKTAGTTTFALTVADQGATTVGGMRWTKGDNNYTNVVLANNSYLNVNYGGIFISGSAAGFVGIGKQGTLNAKLDVSGSAVITGSLNVSNGITGSLFGTSSWAVSSSFTQTASFAPLYLPLTGGTINGNVTVNGTASIAFLNVQYESASVIYSSGSNVFGDATNDTQTLVGTVLVSGSQQITGSLDVAGVVRGCLVADPGAGGTVTGKILSYGPSPYGLVTRGYSSGIHSIQNQREANDAEPYGLVLQPLGGNVGIGTTTAPSQKLEVNGNAIVTGSLSVSNGITGSLFGTSSWAVSASWAPSNIASSVTNNYDNNILTATGGSTINGETYLQFDGTLLSLQGRHQEGGNNLANGTYSHAEGDHTTTYGIGSHAEGGNTIASGSYSHVEGYYTSASGDYSHAEGYQTVTRGQSSHAEGYSTLASGSYSHAEGNSTQTTGSYSHAEGSGSRAIGIASHAEGSITKASGPYSHAEGDRTIASGPYSHTEGAGYAPQLNTKISLTGSSYVQIVGPSLGVYASVLSTGTGSVVAYTGYNPLGSTSFPVTLYGLYIQSASIGANVNFSYETTPVVALSGSFNASMGYTTIFFTPQDMSRSFYSVIGNGLYAQGTGSHAEGFSTNAGGDYSHAEGQYTYAGGVGSHAEGSSNATVGLASHAEGVSNTAQGDYSHAEGQSNTAAGQSSHAEGYANNITSTGNCSHAEGQGNVVYGAYSHAEGANTTAQAMYSHTEGLGTITYGTYSHAEGYYSNAFGTGSHAEGQYTYAYGDYSHTEGNSTQAPGFYAHAEGYSTIASASYSHAEGYGATTKGLFSHAEGQNTIASGSFSHAEGNATIAIGDYSHAEGYSTLSSENYSHAEGANTVALGPHSHAEGVGTRTVSSSAHAEGYYTIAEGYHSHAEGNNTLAIGEGSHAEGRFTTSSGHSSHAAGYFTVADGRYQSVIGQYNVSSSAESAFIIGNGTGLGASRRNLLFASGSQVQITGSLNTTKDATINGVRVGIGEGDINTNTIVGVGSLGTNSSGTNNTGVGYGALNDNSTGTGNTAVGFSALCVNTVGNSNTVIGREAGANLSGTSNLLLGAYAGSQITAASYNNIIGADLYLNPEGGNFDGSSTLSIGKNSSDVLGYPHIWSPEPAIVSDTTAAGILTLDASKYSGFFLDYTIDNQSGVMRAGTLKAVFLSGLGTISFTEVDMLSIGDSSAAIFTVVDIGSGILRVLLTNNTGDTLYCNYTSRLLLRVL